MSTKSTEKEHQTQGLRLPFASINEPGAYCTDRSGHLVRIPEDAVNPGRSPELEILGNDTVFVTKLSDDPFIPVTKARMIAADFDLTVRF